MTPNNLFKLAGYAVIGTIFIFSLDSLISLFIPTQKLTLLEAALGGTLLVSGIVLHELGHYLTYRFYNVPSQFDIDDAGPKIQPLKTPHLSDFQDIFVTIFGNINDLVFCLLLLVTYQYFLPSRALLYASYFSLFLTFINFFPTDPGDDGSQIVANLNHNNPSKNYTHQEIILYSLGTALGLLHFFHSGIPDLILFVALMYVVTLFTKPDTPTNPLYNQATQPLTKFQKTFWNSAYTIFYLATTIGLTLASRLLFIPS